MANINWWTVALLVVSNLIMLYAWYGHLKSLSGAPIWVAILVSWSIALLEYCLAVPANRMGSKTMSLEQLKITQEAIALLTFVPFSIVVMKQPVSWNYAAASIATLNPFMSLMFIFLFLSFFFVVPEIRLSQRTTPPHPPSELASPGGYLCFCRSSRPSTA